MQTKRFLSITVTTAIASSVLLSGCGSSSGGTTTAGATTKNSSASANATTNSNTNDIAGKTVTVWVSSGAEDDVYRKMFDNIQNDLNVTIDDQYYSKDELDNKLKSSQIAGDMPDAVVADYLMIPNYYEAGLVQNLDDYIAQDQDYLNDELPSIKSECTYNGHTISVAQFDAGLCFWANKSMLEKAGVRIPTSYKDAWTKEEFEDALKKLKDSGVEWPLYVRQNKPSTEYYTWMPFVASFGGDYMNRETGLTKGTLNGENKIAAFDYLKSLFDQGYCDPNCDYEDSFQKGENALVLYGHSKYETFKEALGDDLILVPLPDMGNGVYTCSGSTVMIMMTGAKEKGNDVATWAVLDEAINKENIKMVVNSNGAVPARSSVMDAIDDYKEGGRLYLYREQLEAGISFMRPYTPAHMTIYNEMSNVFSDIYAGADPRQELNDAASSIDDIIIENGWNIK